MESFEEEDRLTRFRRKRENRRARRGLSLGATLLGLAFIGALTWLAFYVYTTEKISRGAGKIADVGAKAVETVKEAVIRIGDHMRPEVIQKTFVQWKDLEVHGTQGNILEVATARSEESFTRIDDYRVASMISLGMTVSEITVPATYRYHIDLNGDWRMKGGEGSLVVVCPPVRPSLPVAFDSTGMRKKTKSGWARWNAEQNLALLESSLSPQLAVRAADPRSLNRVREPSRKAVAEFLKRWLLTQDHWREGRYTELHVLFPDEVPEGGLETLPLAERVPTLKLPPEKPVLEPKP